jgi:hypothetical protein
VRHIAHLFLAATQAVALLICIDAVVHGVWIGLVGALGCSVMLWAVAFDAARGKGDGVN